MKKGTKKFTACLALTLLMGSVAAVPAFAVTSENNVTKNDVKIVEQEIQPRYDICSCGGRLLHTMSKENISNGMATDTRTCTHGKRGYDNYEYFKYTDRTYCTGTCGYDASKITYGYEWVCYGR